jgi:hypothetical protein
VSRCRTGGTCTEGKVPSMSEPKPWQPGDRVIVRLPDRSLARLRGGAVREADVHGTVRTVDGGVDALADASVGSGVHVDLDREVNGRRNCYATHRELRPEVPGDH